MPQLTHVTSRPMRCPWCSMHWLLQGVCMPLCNLTQSVLTDHIPAGSVDFCSLIFVLSAIDPSKMPQVKALPSVAGRFPQV